MSPAAGGDLCGTFKLGELVLTVTAAVSSCWLTLSLPRTLLQQGPAMGSAQRLSRL